MNITNTEISYDRIKIRIHSIFAFIIIFVMCFITIYYEYFSIYFFVIGVFVLLVVFYPQISAPLYLTNGLLLTTFFYIMELEHISALMIIGSLLIIGAISERIKNYSGKKIKIKISWIILTLVLAIGIILFLQTLRSPIKSYGLQKSIYYFINNFVFFLIPFIFFKTKESLHKIYSYGAILGIIFIILSIISIWKYGIQERLDTTGQGSVIWYARALGMFSIFSVYQLVNHDYKLKKLVFSMTFIVCLYFMYLSGSRAPILSLLVAVLIPYILKVKIRPYLKILTLIIFIGLFFLIINYVFYLYSARFSGLYNDMSAILRIYSAYAAFDFFIQNPFLGWGTGSFAFLVGEFLKYPHNIFLELAMETGIFGLLMFTIMIVIVTILYLRLLNYNFRKKELEIIRISFIIFLFGFFNAQFSGDITGNPILWFGIGSISIFYNKNIRNYNKN